MGLVPAIPLYPARIGAILFVLLCLGMGVGVESVLFSSAFMRNIPPEFMGRASGLSNAVLCAAMPVGAFLCSAAASAFALEAIVMLAGAVSCVLYLAIARIKSLDRLGDSAKPSPSGASPLENPDPV